MSERITFVVKPEFKKVIDKYCKEHNQSVSGFIKQVVSDKLIEEKYLKVTIL